jgi:hypothetical protein
MVARKPLVVVGGNHAELQPTDSLNFANTLGIQGLPVSTANGEPVVHEQFAAPGPIGETTPNTAKFTFLSGSREFVSTANGEPVVHEQFETVRRILGLSALRALPTPSNSNTLYTLAYRTTPGDVDMPSFYWSATDTRADNNGTIIRPTAIAPASPGRYIVTNIMSYRAEWFGCVGDNGVTDNGAQFQQAIDACIAAGVGILEFGVGRFYYTTAVSIPTGNQLSISGQGSNKTILYPVNQHGITINNNNSEGIVSVISRLHIQCSGQNYCAIYAPGTQQAISDGTRLYGYLVEACTFTNCGVGAYFGYGSKIIIQNNEFINCYYGIVFRGQCIGCIAHSNRFALATSPGAPPVGLVPVLDPGGGSQGIWVGGRTYTSGYLRCEDVQIRENWTFGYNIGCTVYDCLYSVVDGNDFDYCTSIGVFFNSTDGGIRINNNWIGMDCRTNAIQAGISSNTAAGVNSNLPTIRDNHIAVVGTTQGGVGIRILYNAYEGTIVENNSIDCEVLQYGIFFDRVNDGSIIRNKLYGTINGTEDYIALNQCNRTKILDNQTPGRFPYIGDCTNTIGRYFISGLGILHQDGRHFRYFNGSTFMERIGANEGDINTVAANYTAASGGGFNPAAPGPIGETTPNTAKFTFLSGSRELVATVIPNGTTLTRTAHIGKTIQINGGTITFPLNANWDIGDEVEAVVVGTNTTTINGNGINLVGPEITGQVSSVILPGTVGSSFIFKKMPGPLIYVIGGPITPLSLDGLSDVTIASPRKDDVPRYNGTIFTNDSLPLSVYDRWERSFYTAGGGSSITTYGVSLTNVGTVSTPQMTNTNIYSKVNKFLLTSAATAGALSSLRFSNRKFYRGTSTSEGGFEVVITFGLSAMQVGQRGFFGISTANANATNVDPLTTTAESKIGVACIANTGNWTLIYNAAGTAPTQVALGANFPIDTTSWYELYIGCSPGATNFFYEVVNKTNGQTTGRQTITTNIPPNNVYMAPYNWLTNNATAAAVVLALGTCKAWYGI